MYWYIQMYQKNIFLLGLGLGLDFLDGYKYFI